MKKFLLILFYLSFSYISFSQNRERELSDYEKYRLAKEKNISPDTIYKYDTVYVDNKKGEEYEDDLYYIPSKNSDKKKEDYLDTKKKELELKEKELDQYYLYLNEKEKIYEDFYYTYLIYQFSRPYYFSYYINYWSTWYYYPIISDFWYWRRPYFRIYYPYYEVYYYPYYISYYNYNSFYLNYPIYYTYNKYHYNKYNYREKFYRYPGNNYIIPQRRENIYQGSKNPIIINRTIEVNKNSNYFKRREFSTHQTENRRYGPVNNTSRINSNNRIYNTETNRRGYTPTYERPEIHPRQYYNTNRGSMNINKGNSTERNYSRNLNINKSQETIRPSNYSRQSSVQSVQSRNPGFSKSSNSSNYRNRR
ncbi:MAG TPA: hypothetical protein P5513_04590 [Candidatus Diapherotrites archaeon]|nr:hypothetical protein [Candidatus Diapherotrites archaeon]